MTIPAGQGDVPRQRRSSPESSEDLTGQATATFTTPPMSSTLRSPTLLPTHLPRTLAAARLLPAPGGNAALNRLAALAARLLSAPSAQVSLLTDEQIVAGGVGLPEGTIGSSSPLEDSLCTVTAAGSAPLVVTDAPMDPRVAGLPPVTSGAVGSYLGAPLVSAGGLTVGAVCVFGPGPREWSGADVELLGEVAASVLAELELGALSAEYESSRLRWLVAIEGSGIGSFDWDLVTGRVEWDEQLQDLFGYAAGELVPPVSEAMNRIDPADRPMVEAAVGAALAGCGDYRAEFRVLVPGGQVRWLAARGRVTPGPSGLAARLVGTCHDITETRAAGARAAHVLATMSAGYLALDRDWQVTYLNASGERVLRLPADEVVGRMLWEVFPDLQDGPFGRAYHEAVDTGKPVVLEAHDAHLDGWYDVRAIPGPDGLELYFLDITDRQVNEELARASLARLELLSKVSVELAETLEAEPAVARLAQLAVPALGDWCIVTVVDDNGALKDIGWQHADLAMHAAVRRYAAIRIADMHPQSLFRRALATGIPQVVAKGELGELVAAIPPGESADLMRLLAPDSGIVLPLRARERNVGVLTIFRGVAREGFTEADIATAAEVAARAGLALDNARLYSQQRQLAEGLQRSLLTAPPEPDHCEIVVRYAPAAETASVGGDWFDSFLQPDGDTVLVIGDVVGHDTEAAAAMGQVRAMLRGIAWFSGAGPADILTGLDAAMRGLQVDTTATAVVARLEQSRDEFDRGMHHLRWSNAGHPPPLVLDTSGVVSTLDGPDPDLLLGIDPGTARTESVVGLDAGCTVLLYTDGLVERRGQSLDEGLALLRATLAELAGKALNDVCDELLLRMLPDRAEDDVALVAVRLHPQDAPRPPEAGPVAVPPDVPPETPAAV